MNIRPNLYILSDNQIASIALKKFQNECSEIETSEELMGLMDINNYIYSSISGLPLEKFFISLTSSKSIFYRFKIKNSSYEIKWEVFSDTDELDGFYCALHIYNNGIKEKSVHGSVDYIYEVINNTLFKTEEIYSVIADEYTTPFYQAEYA